MKKKVIRLNENDIENIVKKILRESEFDWTEDIEPMTPEEELIIKIIDYCDKEPHGDGFAYTKNGNFYFYQDDETKEFYVDYDDINKVLESKFGPNHMELMVLIERVLERHYNLKGYTISPT